jgi:hypothetical protein
MVSGAVFEAPAVVAGLDDVAVMGDPSHQPADIPRARRSRPTPLRRVGGGRRRCSTR